MTLLYEFMREKYKVAKTFSYVLTLFYHPLVKLGTRVQHAAGHTTVHLCKAAHLPLWLITSTPLLLSQRLFSSSLFQRHFP